METITPLNFLATMETSKPLSPLVTMETTTPLKPSHYHGNHQSANPVVTKETT